MTTQRGNGSWVVVPDPRVTETALTCFVLSRSADVAAHAAVRRGRAWLRMAVPQSHHPVALAVESWLRATALHGRADSGHGTATEAWSARVRLLRIVALRADGGEGVPGSWRILLAEIERACGEARTARLKPWSHVELLAGRAMVNWRLAAHDKARENVLAVVEHQAPDGSCYGNPISTALAFAAFDAIAPGTEPWRRALRWLLDGQHQDGTWRFCSSDVWDTTLTMRAFRGVPLFDTKCGSSAAGFLLDAQNSDGGWPFASAVESDNDTTAAAVLALTGGGAANGGVPRALVYLAERQTSDGLWRTWQFRDDPPAEDVVAHVVTALLDHGVGHAVSLTAAVRWLVERRNDGGRWTASWYRGLPYATLEVGSALRDLPVVVAAAAGDLAATQNDDGGWPAERGEASTPSNTGLALAMMLRGKAMDERRWQSALGYLLGTHRGDGTWPGRPEMYGPRPLLTHFPTHTQAFTVLGLRAARTYRAMVG
ncbi:MAG: prenyltransferase/squalene oxidase repeat-containing protein [Actinophytocola sp.]|uniref:hypothetical protein n=1 Tax=Actinophytocola sp. TaxID=1872138 RepID=UPI003C730F5A